MQLSAPSTMAMRSEVAPQAVRHVLTAPSQVSRTLGPALRPRVSRRAHPSTVTLCTTEGSEVVADDKSAGRMTYKPATFKVMVDDAAGSIQKAMEDGLNRLEVEFPPLPGSVDGYKGASDVFIDSNAQLAIAAARTLSEGGKRVHILLPDANEYRRTGGMFKSTFDLYDGITVGHLQESEAPGPINAVMNMFGGGLDPEEATAAAAKADVFLAINASTVELPSIEKYTNFTVKDRTMVLWNLELDTLRADLGLVAFPPKDLQYNFLCNFKPVFYLRPRDYSKSVAVAPFILNYSGALFREYPGPWQVMLKQDSGEYACVAEDKRRYNLGEVKEELMDAMGLNTELEGSAMEFLRRGYKRSTWWEDDEEEEKSDVWRT